MSAAGKVDLILEGGGAKGLAGPGAVIRLLEEGYTFPRIAGTSAGAVIAAVVAAIQKAERSRDDVLSTLTDVMGRLEPGKIPDSLTPALPILGSSLSLWRGDGLFKGDYIRDFVHRELKELGVETFADLRRDDPDDDENLPREKRYSLVVMATDVTHGRLLRLPWDYPTMFHREPDDELVADAVRMSLSIPFYFDPCTLTDQTTGHEATVVDGGLLSNFPVEAFDRTDGKPPRWPTFGVRFIPDLPEGLGSVFPFPPGILRPAPLRLLEQVVATTVVGRDQTFLDRPGVRDRMIEVDTSGVQITEFHLTDAQRDQLTSQGWRGADLFLQRRSG